MEEIVNENQPAPKVEKISLAELRAEAAKISEEENKHLQEQREFEEKLRQKKLKKEKELSEKDQAEKEAFDKEFEMFLQGINSFSEEDKQKFNEFLENPLAEDDKK